MSTAPLDFATRTSPMDGFWHNDLAHADPEIAAAIVGGRSRAGRPLAPAMPSPSYAALSPEDLDALVAWLRAQPAVPSPRFGPVTDATDAPAPFYRVTAPTAP